MQHVGSMRWSGVGRAYARSFASLCEGTVGLLLDRTHGDDHLDVGCGAGALARAAAGRGRRVVAVDHDRDMTGLTRAATEGLDVRVVGASLPALGLPDATFDVVTANFVVNHVPDPTAAVRELARVVRPGGQVAVTSWTSRPTLQAQLFRDSFAAAGAVAVPGQRLPEQLDYERSVEGVAGLLTQAGLTVTASGERCWDWRVSWDDLWAGISGGVGGVGESYLAQTEEVRARIERELRARCAEHETAGLFTMPSVAAWAVAVR